MFGGYLLTFSAFSLLKVCHPVEVFEVPIPRSLHPQPEKIVYERRNNSNCNTLRSQREECKFYGECCGDPIRIRERLEPETFQCMNIGNTQGNDIYTYRQNYSRLELCQVLPAHVLEIIVSLLLWWTKVSSLDSFSVISLKCDTWIFQVSENESA